MKYASLITNDWYDFRQPSRRTLNQFRVSRENTRTRGLGYYYDRKTKHQNKRSDGETSITPLISRKYTTRFVYMTFTQMNSLKIHISGEQKHSITTMTQLNTLLKISTRKFSQEELGSMYRKLRR